MSFPDPVDEVSARLVAGGVVVMAAAVLAFDQHWLLLVLAYGFLARVAAGPRFSPLGLLVTRLVRPRLPVAPRPVPGPPKRFAQGIGAALTTVAALAWYAVGWHDLARTLVAVLGLFAALESFFGFCAGCKVYGLLISVGVVPEQACEDCADIRRRRVRTA